MPEINMDPDEALVLFELLSRYSDTEELKAEYPGERTALMALLAYLEKQLAEQFHPEYGQLLEGARKRLADRSGERSE